MLDFVQPAGSCGRAIGERWLARANEAEWRISSPAECWAAPSYVHGAWACNASPTRMRAVIVTDVGHDNRASLDGPQADRQDRDDGGGAPAAPRPAEEGTAVARIFAPPGTPAARPSAPGSFAS
jgi:hypothetical protein